MHHQKNKDVANALANKGAKVFRYSNVTHAAKLQSKSGQKHRTLTGIGQKTIAATLSQSPLTTNLNSPIVTKNQGASIKTPTIGT